MASLLALGSGCALFVVGAAAGAGAAGYAWVDGEIKTTEAASMNQTWDATLAAMKDLQFTVTSQAKDALQGYLTARNANNTSHHDQIEIPVQYLDRNPHSRGHVRR